MEQDRRLRVLQIVSSSTTSGAERHVYSLSKLLHDWGHHVEVVTPEGGWLPGVCRDADIPVHQTVMRGSGWFRTFGYMLRRLKAGQIDVVHTHLTRATYFGAMSGFLRRVPVVATVHIANHDQVYKRMARGRNRLVAVSNYVRGMLHGRGIPDRFIDTVYNGTDFVELGPFVGDGVHDEFEIPRQRKLVGLVGRVCREKGHMLMVRAMKQVLEEHADSHLMFVGRIESDFDGELRDEIQSQGIGEHTTFTGARQDIPRLLDAFEFTTMPSHKETFGIAAIEAMARRRPVVASRVGGLPEVVHHGQTGLLVDLRPDDLAEAVSYLLEHESERKQMGEMGRRIVEEKFTHRQMANRLQEVYLKAAR